MRPILLDTCAALWLASSQLPKHAVQLLDEAGAHPGGIAISPITAWEVAMLVSRNRLSFSGTTRLWWRRLTSTPGAFEADMGVNVLIAAQELPEPLHRDPADRILAATAREFGYRLMTRDRPLLAYADAGHLQAIAC